MNLGSWSDKDKLPQSAQVCLPVGLTFGAVVVPIQVTILRLLLPPHNIVREVAVGVSGRVPFHNEL